MTIVKAEKPSIHVPDEHGKKDSPPDGDAPAGAAPHSPSLPPAERRYARGGLFWVIAPVVALAGYFAWNQFMGGAGVAPTTADALPRVALATDVADAVIVPTEVRDRLGLATAAAIAAPEPAPLRLEGSLFLDPSRLTRVHTRFPGEVVELGVVHCAHDDEITTARPMGDPPLVPRSNSAPSTEHSHVRPIRFGDHVTQGQLLAVIWSKDLGEKKSELVDAISRLTLDRETAQRFEKLYQQGAVPERSLREMERNVESDIIAVARAERTLRSWRVSDRELNEIRAEAERIHEQKGQWDHKLDATWARVEVVAAIDGVVVEKNVAVGDVVDTGLDLFKIADLDRLDVLAHAYEEDLPLLERLKPRERQWNIGLKSGAEGATLRGNFDQIGNIIDPNQHTALVMGWVDNREGRLRVGQFVTAEVGLPADPNETAVPKAAIVDLAGEAYVFVHPEAGKPVYRRVRINREREFDHPRLGPLAYVSGAWTAALTALNKSLTETNVELARQGKPLMPLFEPLPAGTLVVVDGGLELSAELESLKSEARVAAQEAAPGRP